MGTRYVFHALARNGRADLALQIATYTKQPSFGFMVTPRSHSFVYITVWIP
jgi:hypothetical protein